MLQLLWSICALAAELGLERLHRHAVALVRAVAAALAHRVVDEHALGGIGEGAALAAAALLGGAGLVVDQHGEAGDLAQLALHGIELVAMTDGDAMREAGIHRILVGLVGDDDHLLGALGLDLARDLGNRERAVMRLAAGHGDGVVVEDLVGDVDAGRRRLADRHQAGVVIGAVAEILEDVLLGSELSLADPRHALAAHVGDQRGAPLGHPDRHAVAADAGHGAAAFRARASKCCAGSPSRRTACAPPWAAAR